MQEKVTIYTKDYCPYCDRAKEYFASRKIPFEEIDVTRSPQVYEELKARTRHITVPQIFIGDKFIGGYTDMMDKIRRGELTITAPD